MILADKIIELRKSRGWSQEELAQRLDVTRQSVSKWESAQSVPDLDRILEMSRLFGVSTDFLLKEEIEIPETPEKQEHAAAAEDPGMLRGSESDAAAYLDVRAHCAPRIALATLLCVFSPIPLLLMGAMTETHPHFVSEQMAGGMGVIVLLGIAAAAVVLFIRADTVTRPYAAVCEHELCTDAVSMVRQRQAEYRARYNRLNLIAAVLCILSPVSLLAAAFFTENVLALMIALAGTMLIAGGGAALFILVGVPWAAMKRLLREGEYSSAQTSPAARRRSALLTAFWLCAVAVYLLWSLLGQAWQISWVVWPVAGVLYAALSVILHSFTPD